MSADKPNGFGWAILGTGGVSRKFVLGLRALGADAARLVAVASRSQANADRFAQDFSIPLATSDYAAAASAASADAVYIATPPSEHEAHALMAIEAGKAVLIEKPFALDAPAARRIAEAARAKGVFCMEALWTRFMPLVETVAKMVDEGAIGAPRGFEGRFLGADVPDPANSLFDPARGGGALMHRGVYPLALAQRFLGPIEEVASMARIGETGVDEDCVAMLRHASGAISNIRASLRATGVNDASLLGEKATIEIDAPIYRPFQARILAAKPRQGGTGGGRGGGKLEGLKEGGLLQGLQQRASGLVRLARGGGGKALMKPYGGNGYHYEAAEVMRAVAAGETESPVMPLDDTLTVMAVIDAAKAQWAAA